MQKLDKLDVNVVNEQVKTVSNSLISKKIKIKSHVENQEKKLERLLGSTEKKLTNSSNRIYTSTVQILELLNICDQNQNPKLFDQNQIALMKT